MSATLSWSCEYQRSDEKVPPGSVTAVSVVGLRETGEDGTAAALGDDDGDDEVTLWHEIRRP